MGNLEENTYIEEAEFKDRFELLVNVGNGELDDKKVDLTIKQISKIIKKASRRRKNIIIITNLDLSQEEEKDNKKFSLISALNACKIKDKNERLEFIYTAACKYLDNEFRNKNICEFANDKCFAKRDTEVTNGCCHEVKMFRSWKKFPVCRYQKNRTCTADCLACKLFTCDEINKKGIKYTCFNVALINYFFNICQKVAIKASAFTPKEKVLRRLRFLNW